MPIERAGAVDRIDRGDNAIERVSPHDGRVRHQGVKNRRGIGEAGRLDHHSGKARDPALGPVGKQLSQGFNQGAPRRAAEAAAVQQHNVLARPLDQQMVEADLAELVDDHRRRRHAGLLQHVVERSRLAAAEEAGQQGYRDCG